MPHRPDENGSGQGDDMTALIVIASVWPACTLLLIGSYAAARYSTRAHRALFGEPRGAEIIQLPSRRSVDRPELSQAA